MNPTHTIYPLTALLALVSLLTAPMPLTGAEKQDGKAKAQQLVWPLPPDKPRYRWLEMFSDLKPFEKSKRFAFVDRLVGNKAGPRLILRPIGVATDSQERVIVSAQTNRAVYVIDRGQKQVLELRGTQNMPFRTPMGVTVDDKDNIFVADSGRDNVTRFAADGTPNASFGQTDGIKNPSYMAVDVGRRRLYVTGTQNHQVFVYNLDTLKLETKFGKPGGKKGEFAYPVGIAVNPKNGNIAVSNTETCSVEIFTPQYKWTNRIGECGDQLGYFTRPKGVAFDQDANLYVVDNAFNSFQVFSPEGHVRMFLGSPGYGPGMFWMPNAIHIDKSNRVYVSEYFGNRVQVFQFLGGN